MKSLEGSTMKHRSTGRKKIPIKKIEETTRRQVTFSKRRAGLFKKASELCVLTGAEMAIIVQSPGGHCYGFGHPSVDAVIDRYENNGSSSKSVLSPKQSSLTEFNVQYAKIEKELEREKRTYEAIQKEKSKSSSSSEFSEFVQWYERDIYGMEVEELEEYVAALVELKRKALVRAGDLANMETARMLSLGSSTYRNSLDNAPLNMQVFGDGIKIPNGPSNGLNFGDAIKIGNNTINGPISHQYFGDRVEIDSNTMNGPTSHQYFGDRVEIDSNTMNGPTSHQYFGDRVDIESNTMSGPTSHQYYGDRVHVETNTMNGPTSHQYFGDRVDIESNTMNGPRNGHLEFEDLGFDNY